jgi:hypothetical protein
MNDSLQSMTPIAKARLRPEMSRTSSNVEGCCFLVELDAARKFTFPGDTLKLLRNGLDPVLLLTALMWQQALNSVLE